MALFGKKKRTGGANEIFLEDEILGTLDELKLQRIPLSIVYKKNERKVSVYFADDKKELVRIQNDPFFDEYVGKTVKCGFTLDKFWHVFEAKIVIQKGDTHLTLPEVITMVQRRKHARASLTAREKVKVTALEGLMAGIGVTGVAADVSIGGVCMVVERAMMLQAEREITPSPEMWKQGTKLMVVKLNRVPGVPPFDTQGKVNRIFREGMHWKIAIEFSKIPSNIEPLIARFVDQRAPRLRPIRRSRKRRLEIESEREQARMDKKAEEEQNTGAEVSAAEESAVNESGDFFEPLDKDLTFVDDTGAPPPPASTSAPTAAEPEPVPEPAPAPSTVTISYKRLLSLGEDLKQHLAFLEKNPEFEWLHVDSPRDLVKTLNERKPGHLLLPWIYKGQSMMDYLQRLSHALKKVDVILFFMHEISPREIIKSKMTGVHHFIKLPLENEDYLIGVLEENVESKEDT